MTKGEWLNAAGLAVSVVGFGLTIWQLTRTARASEATQRAVMRTEHRMALNHLLVLLPQFRLIEADLDAAAESDDRKLAIRALVAYSHIASEVAGLLRNQDGVDKSIPDKLETSARAAALAKAELIDNGKRLPKSVTKQFRSDLADLSLQFGVLVSRFKIEAGRVT